jgi:hypothetical protein
VFQGWTWLKVTIEGVKYMVENENEWTKRAEEAASVRNENKN